MNISNSKQSQGNLSTGHNNGTRKPLTKEQIQMLLPDAVRLPIGWLEFARAIEREHGISI